MLSKPCIALINPSIVQWGSYLKMEPVALTHLAAALEAAGYPVVIFDFEIQLEYESYTDLVRRIAHHEVVGLSFYSNAVLRKEVPGSIELRVHPLQLIKDLKAINNGITLIAGGPGVTSSDLWLLNNYPEVDIAVRGEGENVLVTLLNVLSQRKPLESVPGITFRRGNEIIQTAGMNVERDLDSLPLPARHLLPYPQRYRATVVSSRGCPHTCTFCQPESPKKYRLRAADAVVAEIEQLNREHGHWYIDFADPNFCGSPTHARQIAEGILERGLDILFSVTATSRTLCRHPELIQLLRRAGCLSINLGVESFLQRRLDGWRTLKKADEHVAAIRHIRGLGMGVVTSFILFDAATTVEDLRHELEMIEITGIINCVDEYSNRLRLLPGSALNMGPTYKDFEFQNQDVALIYEGLQRLLDLRVQLVAQRNALVANPRAEVRSSALLRIMTGYYQEMRFAKQAEFGLLVEGILRAENNRLHMGGLSVLARIEGVLMVMRTLDPRHLPGADTINPRFEVSPGVVVKRMDDDAYTVVDYTYGRVHRLNQAAFMILQCCRDHYTFNEIVSKALEMDTREDTHNVIVSTVAALATLHANLLVNEVPPAVAPIFSLILDSASPIRCLGGGR